MNNPKPKMACHSSLFINPGVLYSIGRKLGSDKFPQATWRAPDYSNNGLVRPWLATLDSFSRHMVESSSRAMDSDSSQESIAWMDSEMIKIGTKPRQQGHTENGPPTSGTRPVIGVLFSSATDFGWGLRLW